MCESQRANDLLRFSECWHLQADANPFLKAMQPEGKTALLHEDVPLGFCCWRWKLQSWRLYTFQRKEKQSKGYRNEDRGMKPGKYLASAARKRVCIFDGSSSKSRGRSGEKGHEMEKHWGVGVAGCMVDPSEFGRCLRCWPWKRQGCAPRTAAAGWRRLRSALRAWRASARRVRGNAEAQVGPKRCRTWLW